MQRGQESSTKEFGAANRLLENVLTFVHFYAHSWIVPPREIPHSMYFRSSKNDTTLASLVVVTTICSLKNWCVPVQGKMMQIGPLLRLKLFGFLCPCYESDEEHAARVAAWRLNNIDIEWFRTAIKPGSKESSAEVSLEAFIRLVDRPLGPALEVLSCDPVRKTYSLVSLPEPEMESQGRLSMDVPLSRMERVCLGDDDEYCYDGEIQIRGSKPSMLLRFAPSNTDKTCLFAVASEEVATNLGAVVAWDRTRRQVQEEETNRKEAMERLREEKERLMMEDEPQQQQ